MSESTDDTSVTVVPSHIIAPESTTPVVYQGEDDRQYGHMVRSSAMCNICRNTNIHKIHLARARDFKTYREISEKFGVPYESVKKHFDNHYALSEYSLKAIALKENTTPEAKELISKIFDGKTDFLEGSSAVLRSKVSALHSINARIEALTDKNEIDSAEDIDKQEYIALHKLRQNDENDIIKIYALMDKKIFPVRKEELASAVLAYKLEVLQRIFDEVALTIGRLRGLPEYAHCVEALAAELATRFNQLEISILNSGGIIPSAAEPTGEPGE